MSSVSNFAGSFSGPELGLLTGSTAFSLAVGYLVVSDFSMLPNKLEAKGKPIAAIEVPENVVKRRPAGLPVWNEVSASESLYQYDQVYTDENSRVKIRFDSNDEIEVAENALVVIERFDDMASVDVKRGVVLATVKSATPKLAIKAGKSRTVLQKRDSAAIIQTNDRGEAKVTVSKGEAQVQTKNKVLSVEQDKEVEINQNEPATIRAPKVNLTLPQLGYTDITPGEVRSLSWSDAGASSYILEVATDPGFNNLVHVKETKTRSSVLPSFLDGQYFVRVGAKMPSGMDYSVAKQITFSKLSPPEAKWPAQGKIFDQTDGEFQTFLGWEDIPNQVRVELANDKSFRSKLFSQVADGSPFSTGDLPVGDYYWRLQAIGKSGKLSAWGPTRTFSVAPEEIPEPVIPPVTLSHATVGNSKGDLDIVGLNWNEFSGASQYEIEIAQDEDFTQIIEKAKTDKTSLRWRPPRVGNFFWRVRADSGEFSEALTVSVAPQVTPVLPADGTRLDMPIGSSVDVRFSWRQRIGAARFTLQVSNSPRFDVIYREIETANTGAMISVRDAGSFYWRVRSNYGGAAKNIPAVFSEIRQFEVREVRPKITAASINGDGDAQAADIASLAPAPKLVGPMAKSVVTGSADGSASSVNLRWQPLEKTSSYQLQIASNPQFDDVILDRRSARPQSAVKLKPGRYFWRVRGNGGQWSPAIGFRVRGVLPAPKVFVKALDDARKLRPGQMDLRWSRVKSAKKYEVEIAKDLRFRSKLLTREASNLEVVEKVPPGDYFGRVRAVGVDGTKGLWSKPVEVAVLKARILSQLDVKFPKDGMSFTYRKKLPRVEFGWQTENKFIDGFDVQIARDSGFSELALNAQTKKNRMSFPLREGEYYWRVRSRRESDVGPWSAKRRVDVELNNRIPELVFPRQNGRVNFDENERRSVDITWDKTDDLENLVVLLAKDAGFARLVGRIKADGTAAKVLIPDDGVFYWQVRGVDKREKVVVVSNYNKFEVTTTEVTRPTYIEDTFRIEAAYTPTRLDYKHTGESSDKLEFDVNFRKAYQYALRGWFNLDWGFEAEFNRKWADVVVDVDSEDVDAQRPFFDLIDSGGAFKRRFRLFRSSYPLDFGLRFGYYYHPILTFFADGEGTYGLVSSDAHNLVTGIETLLPLGGSLSLETRFDYLTLLTESPITVKSSTHYVMSMTLAAQFWRYVATSLGVLYRNQSYKYDDPANQAKGTLDAEFLAFLYALGYVF